MKNIGIINKKSLFYSHSKNKIEAKHIYSSHMHESYELIYFLQGNAIFSNEVKNYHLIKGDLIISPPFTYHCMSLQTGVAYERINILFDIKDIPESSLSELMALTHPINCSDIPLITHLFQSFDYYKDTLSPDDFTRMAYLLLEQLLLTLKTIPTTINELNSPETHPLSTTLQYINDNLLSITSIKDLCRKLYISEPYLHKMFNKILKTSPAKYINMKRLYLAKQLLSLNQKPTDVYLECGYNDYSTFYRNYTKHFGVPPSKNS